jgi:CheY-like chemotaxis protein
VHSAIIDKVQHILNEAKFQGTTILLNEFGNFTLRKDMRSIAFPVHVITIANALNNVETIGNYNENENTHVRFTAPDARVLVVDDIATNIKVVEGLISPCNIQIITCMNGKDAIDLVRENQYDLIFMDHMMPVMDGVEATAAIRLLEGDYYKKIPIIALTANAIFGMKEMFLEKGFNDFLSKPIEISELDEIMGKWIPNEKKIKTNSGISTAAVLTLKNLPHEKTVDRTAKTASINIQGVDTVKGIAMTGGTEAGYRKVLQSFYKDALERLPLLEKIPAREALPIFTTQVHALKSATGAIGAVAVSNLAAELEATGQAGNLEAIGRSLKVFYGDLQDLTEKIGLAMEEFNSLHYDEVSPSETLNQCIPLFANLSLALEQEDIALIHRILSKLGDMPLDAKTKEIINSIFDAVLISEFEKAVKLTAGLQRTPC